METPKLSFTLVKQKRPLLTSSKIGDHSVLPEKNRVREYITTIEDKVIHSDKPQEKQIIVPLIHNKSGIRQRIRSIHEKPTVRDSLTEQAIRELKQDNLLDDVGMDGRISVLTKEAVASDGQSDDINYDAVPVESFGLAVLAGMGFDPNELKSSVGQSVGPIRPKGLGLGADPHAVQAARQDAATKSDEKLCWRPGARCQVVLGKNKGLYGTINGLDGDTGRVIVKFTISKEIVAVLQPLLRLVPEKEYAKYATCLNQKQVDEYKANEAKHDVVETGQFNSSFVSDPAVNRNPRSHTESRSWVKPNLLVRFLDKRFKDGRYYKEKVIITSVDSGLCTCRTSSGRMIEGVSPNYLQTVVPRDNNSMVMVLSGPRSGEMAKLVDQNPSRNEVDLRTRSGTMIQLTYDQVCCVADSP